MLKRCFDLLISGLGVIILSPVLIIIALSIKLTSSDPILFRQVRVGKNEKLFNIHKFRTMTINAEQSGLLTIGDDKRVTFIGKILRKSKLDELPQLFDVLIGKMSLVGPRPEVPKYVDYYPPEVRTIIFSLRPGITDFASIKMIDENLLLAKESDPEKAYIEKILPQKLGFAVKYAKTRSLLLDIYIIWLTLVKIVKR